MRSYRQAIAVALATFVASIFGMGLRLVVPAQVLNDSKATIGGMAPFPVTGARPRSARLHRLHGLLDAAPSEAQGLGPVVVELDDLLEQYGPEALRGRVALREALGRSRRRFFGDPERGPSGTHLRGDPGNHPLEEHLPQQPPARNREAAATAVAKRTLQRLSPRPKC